MKKLIGSEKQIAWAEEIRERYVKLIPVLQEAIEILKDTRVTEDTIQDPLGRSKIIKKQVYVKQLGNKHDAARNISEKIIGLHNLNDVMNAQEKFGKTPSRERDLRYHEWVKEKIQDKIENETSAKFWIDNR